MTFSAADLNGRAKLGRWMRSMPKGSDERGAFRRREGLYSSHMSEWRRQRYSGALTGLAPKD